MPDAEQQADLEQAAALIRDADALVIAAGAGMGVDSGLPDFRGSTGFWREYPALGRARMSFTDVATPHTFRTNPRLAWGFYGHRLQLYRKTQPHAGFDLLRAWGESKPNGYFVFTSNVDGQFGKAGFSELLVEECHGSIHHLQCLRDCTSSIWTAADFEPEVNPDSGQLIHDLPQCPHCGGLARPNILMFDDGTWNDQRQQLQLQRKRDFLARAQKPVVVELGAGGTIATVRHFSKWMVSNGARLVRINPLECEVSEQRDVGLGMPACEALRKIDDLM